MGLTANTDHLSLIDRFRAAICAPGSESVHRQQGATRFDNWALHPNTPHSIRRASLLQDTGWDALHTPRIQILDDHAAKVKKHYGISTFGTDPRISGTTPKRQQRLSLRRRSVLTSASQERRVWEVFQASHASFHHTHWPLDRWTTGQRPGHWNPIFSRRPQIP